MTTQTYEIEMTDTFGGEANYCWVQRETVTAKSMRGAFRAARNALGLIGRWKCDMDSGDMRRYVPVGGHNFCVFINWSEY